MYSCDSGYSLEGQSRRQCLADGNWDGAPPSCRKSNKQFILFCRNGLRRHYLRVTQLFQSTLGTKWRLHILPKYHASLTKPIKYKESDISRHICPCANDIVHARFEDVRTFLQFLWASFSCAKMGKFTVAYGGFNVVRAKPQATRPKVRMGRSRELPHALNTNQI